MHHIWNQMLGVEEESAWMSAVGAFLVMIVLPLCFIFWAYAMGVK